MKRFVGLACAALATVMAAGAGPAGPAGASGHPSRVPASGGGAAAVGTAAPHARSAQAGYSLPDPPAGGKAYRWDPCAGAITYAVNLAGAPDRAGALKAIRYALGRVRAATGLRFSYAGSTRKTPQASWGISDYPADIVVAWAAPGSGRGRSDVFSAPAALAEGGWLGYSQQYRDGNGKARVYAIVSRGFVVVNKNETKGLPLDPAASGGMALLMMHELGHVMTLQHVDDAAQVMYPMLQPGRAPSWGPGDKAGLKAVGASKGCVAPPS